jgi:hypothetical protein
VLGRFWRWLIGKQSVDVNINICIQDLHEITSILSSVLSNSVIIPKEHGSYKEPTVEDKKENKSEFQGKGRKKLSDDPLKPEEVSSILRSGGIEKAKDRTGKDVVSSSQGNSTDQNVSSLRSFFKGEKKDV